MTRYSIAPGYIKLRYESSAFPHVQTLPIKFATAPTPGVEPTLTRRDGDPETFTIALATYLPVLQLFLLDDKSIVSAEVHSYDEDTKLDQFIFGVPIGVEGTEGAVATFVSGQVTVTFKTTFGNIYRYYVMEPSLADNIKSSDFVTSLPIAAIVGYMSDPACVIFGRDGNPVFSPIQWRTKQNDALRAQLGL